MDWICEGISTEKLIDNFSKPMNIHTIALDSYLDVIAEFTPEGKPNHHARL